jgi:hypothetical protein
VALATAATGPAIAQEAYPNRPVRYILPYPPGGSTDPMARWICAKLSERWNQSVVVDNRPGGNTVIGTSALVKSTPDGYSIGWAGASMFSTPTLLLWGRNDGIVPGAGYTLAHAIRSFLCTIARDLAGDGTIRCRSEPESAEVGHGAAEPDRDDISAGWEGADPGESDGARPGDERQEHHRHGAGSAGRQ